MASVRKSSEFILCLAKTTEKTHGGFDICIKKYNSLFSTNCMNVPFPVHSYIEPVEFINDI